MIQQKYARDYPEMSKSICRYWVKERITKWGNKAGQVEKQHQDTDSPVRQMIFQPHRKQNRCENAGKNVQDAKATHRVARA